MVQFQAILKLPKRFKRVKPIKLSKARLCNFKTGYVVGYGSRLGDKSVRYRRMGFTNLDKYDYANNLISTISPYNDCDSVIEEHKYQKYLNPKSGDAGSPILY